MIPAFLREAWRRPEAEAQAVVVPVQGDLAPDPDLIARYALVGIFVIMAVAALSLSRSVALPIVAGIVFGLILGPATDRLVRLGLSQGAAAAIVVLAGILVTLLLFGALAAPFAIWSDQLPGILAALQARAEALLRTLGRLTQGIAPATPRAAAPGGNPWLDIAGYSTSALASLLIFFGTVYFYLASRRAFRARALRLCLGHQARQLAGQFLDEIEDRVAAYFGVVTVINLVMGVITGAIAWAAGFPLPLLWAFGGFLLNYVAYLGPATMAALLLGAGLVQMPDTWWALWPVLAYVAVNTLEGNVVTPMAVGRWLTVAPFLVFVSIVFWLWLWGPVGAILSTPLLLVAVATVEVVSTYRKVKSEEEAEAEPKAAVILPVPAAIPDAEQRPG